MVSLLLFISRMVQLVFMFMLIKYLFRRCLLLPNSLEQGHHKGEGNNQFDYK